MTLSATRPVPVNLRTKVFRRTISQQSRPIPRHFPGYQCLNRGMSSGALTLSQKYDPAGSPGRAV